MKYYLLILSVLISTAAPVYAGEKGSMKGKQSIEIWTRGKGNYTDSELVKKKKLRVVNLKALKNKKMVLRDLQYGKKNKIKLNPNWS